MQTGIICQARSTSTRLPNKVMKEINGKPLLGYVIERLRLCKNIDKIIIATTINQSDDNIASFCEDIGVNVFRGSEDDVLSRYYLAAQKYSLDVVIRITSDCPLIDPKIIDAGVLEFFDKSSTFIDRYYYSNIIERTYPRGMDFEIFHFDALKKAYHSAKEKYEREHVTPYIYDNPDIFKLYHKHNHIDYSNYRITVDTIEDFNFVKEILRKIDYKHTDFFLDDIIDLLKTHPELTEINNHIEQKKLK